MTVSLRSPRGQVYSARQKILPAPLSAAKSYATVGTYTSQRTASVVVVLADAFGNQMAVTPSPLPTVVATLSTGEAVTYAQAGTRGTHTLSMTINGQASKNSPYTLKVLPGPLSADKSGAALRDHQPRCGGQLLPFPASPSATAALPPFPSPSLLSAW